LTIIVKKRLRVQKAEPEVTAESVTEETLRFSAVGSPEDLDDIDVPSVTVSPPTPKPPDDERSRQQDHGESNTQ
jgi:hypothetical protein